MSSVSGASRRAVAVLRTPQVCLFAGALLRNPDQACDDRRISIVRLCHFGDSPYAFVGAARHAIALMASASVNIDTPNKTMSLMRNWPVMDKSGNPPADASPTPGVVITNVNVLTKSTIANTLPNSDTVGYHRDALGTPARAPGGGPTTHRRRPIAVTRRWNVATRARILARVCSPTQPPPGSRRSRSASCGTATSHGCARQASPPMWLPPARPYRAHDPGRLWACDRRPPDRSRGRLLLSGRTDLGHKASCGSIRLTSKTRSDTGQNGFSTWS